MPPPYFILLLSYVLYTIVILLLGFCGVISIPYFLGFLTIIFPLMFSFFRGGIQGSVMSKKTCWIISKIYPKLELIKLIDWKGSEYITLGKTKNNEIETYVCWWFNVGKVTLLPNGINKPNSDSSYILFWSYMDKEKKVIQSLKYDLPDYEPLLSIEKKDIRVTKILDLYDKCVGNLITT